MKRLRYLSFTDKGYALALKLAQMLGGEASRCGAASHHGEASCRGGMSSGGETSPCGGEMPSGGAASSCGGVSLSQWMAENFRDADALVYVGACGIAVRAVAPYLASKTSDPAVVVVDEGGQFAISLLSGHLGGGNDLARMVATACGAVPVITTATDINGVFAVDEWAKHQNCHILNPEKIKEISSALLCGERIGIKCFTKIEGDAPPGARQVQDEADCQVVVDFHAGGSGTQLKLVPRIAVLGVGCCRGTDEKQLEEHFQSLLSETNLAKEAVCRVATIDLKKKERGLIAFCRNHDLPLVTFSAEALAKAEGVFSASEFVKGVTGVDNVCERSAVLASNGKLYQKKRAGGGITMAIALEQYEPDWRWKHE